MHSRALFILLLSGAVGRASAQDAIKSPRDVATGQVAGAVQASNAGQQDIDLSLVSVGRATVRDAATGQSSGRRQRLAARTTNPIFINFEEGSEPAWVLATSAVVKVTRGTAECLVRLSATYKAASQKIEMTLGEASRFFNADGKPVASRCNG